MFVDIWIFGVFAALFGVCAWWNRNSGIEIGIQGTLDKLLHDKVIMIQNDEVLPYPRSTSNKRKRTKYV
jgi:hypothetical protein